MRRTSDPIHLIRTANPVPDPDRMPDGPETLMEEILGMTSTQPQRRKRSRRVPILVLALVGTVIGTAAAASLFINPGKRPALPAVVRTSSRQGQATLWRIVLQSWIGSVLSTANSSRMPMGTEE